MLAWDKQEEKYFEVKINNADWSRVQEPKYTVKDALIYDIINIIVRASSENSYKDNMFTYNSELRMVIESIHFT